MGKSTILLESVINAALIEAQKNHHEFLTPELFFYYGMLPIDYIADGLKDVGINTTKLQKQLRNYIKTLERVPDNIKYEIELSYNLKQALINAEKTAKKINKKDISLFDLLTGILTLEEQCPLQAFILSVSKFTAETLAMMYLLNNSDPIEHTEWHHADDDLLYLNADTKDSNDNYDDIEEYDTDPDWKTLVTKINGTQTSHNPLIGRSTELERTIHVLCKKERHNVLYVGEPGVGKTAMVYGLLNAMQIGEPYMPQFLGTADVYQLDPTTLLAGTQFRGDFEKRIKIIMDGLSKCESAIVYIDDIHTIIGMGAGNEGGTDASNMMLQYMDKDNIRFIGTMSYKDYTQKFSQNKAISRRFQTIEIKEPSTKEAIDILLGIMPIYETYHMVKYRNKPEIAKFAVEMSSKYIGNRFLPEKAIDLIDEAGAYRESHPLQGQYKTQWVDKELVGDMLRKVCNIANIPDSNDDTETASLMKLESKIKAKIYGQNDAIHQVVEAILMSKAGLSDMQKPIASFLFVGQTGVGKTEIVKVLAQELGTDLVRFDMSEYTEKHTVAKLIGSPAGYVGYDDGGLLTTAIRQKPNCVLLLDEIEKAHPDIYNILLQIMDYASLTDNKGQKADFRHVILVMTSNAGAQYAHQATVGFYGASAGSAMMTAVKKTFKPEFINRLSATVLFNDINKEMAALILEKKLNELRGRIKARKITLDITQQATDELLRRGFSPQYGAREIDRVINSAINPLLTKEILFGSLKNGGHTTLDFVNGEMILSKTTE